MCFNYLTSFQQDIVTLKDIIQLLIPERLELKKENHPLFKINTEIQPLQFILTLSRTNLNTNLYPLLLNNTSIIYFFYFSVL